jgi:hypothetical protein
MEWQIHIFKEIKTFYAIYVINLVQSRISIKSKIYIEFPVVLVILL